MTPHELASTATEYVKLSVAADEAGAVVNPTADTVSMAFTPMLRPISPPAAGSTDWKSATWETASGTYYARCLIGPSGVVTLTPNLYDAWIKIQDNPELVIEHIGLLRIT